MGFQISGLRPNFFEPNSESQVWQNNLTFDNQNKYLIHAHSGKGKSSFFRMLSGISKDYQGDIHFNDINLKNASTEALTQMRFENWSLVFQSLALFLELTVKENINVTGVFEDSKEKLENLGIGGKENHLVNQLSYGERQRLAIVKALNKKYDYLIMDEPFSHLDSTLRKKAMTLIEADVSSKNAVLIILDLEDNTGYEDFKKVVL